MKALEIVTIILNIVPALIGVIKAVEDAIPGDGKGEQKLSAVRQIMEVSYAQTATLWPTLQNVIGVLVATFNTVGVFRKKAAE